MEGIRESLMADGLRWRDLKRKPMTVYLILPLDKLGTGATKWFRLCMSTGLNELLKAGPRGLPVLWVIDEFFSVNNPPLKTFQAAMSQAAGAAKMQVLVVLQDLAQLQTMYPHGQGWRTFLSNSAVKIFFGGPMLDKETSEYIAQMCGEQEVIVSSRNVSDDKARRVGDLYDVNIGDGAAVAWQPLIRPHEVRRMSASEMIVFAEKVGAPIFGKRKPYWETHRGYRPNPYYNGGGGGLFGIFR
jgi:type IV secretion system protein VirD4